MRETSDLKHSVIVIDSEGNLLYDNRPAPFYDGPCVRLTGLDAGYFVAYLLIHWPNHWATRALDEDRKRGTLRAETIEDLIREIELTEQDALALKALAEGQAGQQREN